MTMLAKVSHWVYVENVFSSVCVSAPTSLTSSSFSSSGQGWAGVSFALLFEIMTAASAAAFFCASQASLFFSAMALPAATHFGFFAGFVVGVSEVTCCVTSWGGTGPPGVGCVVYISYNEWIKKYLIGVVQQLLKKSWLIIQQLLRIAQELALHQNHQVDSRLHHKKGVSLDTDWNRYVLLKTVSSHPHFNARFPAKAINSLLMM